MQGPTDRQRQALAYIQACIHFDGYPPTLRELGIYLGCTRLDRGKNTLYALVRKGLIEVDPYVPRAIRVTRAGMLAIAYVTVEFANKENTT